MINLPPQTTDMPTKLKRYILTHEGLTISVKEYRASRSLKLIVHEDCTVTLTCPPRTAKMQAANYILGNVDWIRKAVTRFSNRPRRADRSDIEVSPTDILDLRRKAANYIPQRMQQLAAANGLHFEGVTITTTTSKWGSCNTRGQIRISCFVMILTEELIDLVLLHELAHTLVMNHSPKFHATLNALLPMHNEKALNRQLKQYHITKTK
jgi:predicted metal-dependent hydrolase